MQDQFQDLLNVLVKCSECPKMVQSRKEVMGEDHYPLKPFGNIDAKIMIIGIAPGRLQRKYKDPDIKDEYAFQYGSGDILNKIIDKFNIRDIVYITNILKCNSPSDNIFEEQDVKRCITNFLSNEIKIINPEKIIVLGKQAREYFEKYVVTNSKVYFIYHPSYVMRKLKMKDTKIFENYVLTWKGIIDE